MADGITIMTRKKFVRMQTAQVMQNDLIGINGHIVFTRRAKTTVNEV